MATQAQKRRRRNYRNTRRTSANRRLRFSKPLRRSTPTSRFKSSVRRERVITTRSRAKTGTPAIASPKRKHLAIKTLTKQLKKTKLVCIKRAARRQVMHATGKSGQSGQKRPNWTEKSRIKC